MKGWSHLEDKEIDENVREAIVFDCMQESQTCYDRYILFDEGVEVY